MNASITSNDENIMNRYNTDWDSIDWTKAWESVNHLQTRIAKAQSNGQTNAVKRLQHLLVNSYYAKCIAVEKVTTNKGKKTPGVDGTIWSTSKQKIEAVENLKSIGYQAKPLRRVFIPKRNGKKRPLSIPTMHDRAMQALYAMALDPVAEVKADLNSYGFRRGRGARDAAKRLYTVLFQKEAAQWIVEGDIRSCFDKINHEWLMENIPMNKRILNEFLKAGYTYQNKMFSTDEGTPQGGIISPILANMTLDGIEKLLDES